MKSRYTFYDMFSLQGFFLCSTTFFLGFPGLGDFSGQNLFLPTLHTSSEVSSEGRRFTWEQVNNRKQDGQGGALGGWD